MPSKSSAAHLVQDASDGEARGGGADLLAGRHPVELAVLQLIPVPCAEVEQQSQWLTCRRQHPGIWNVARCMTGRCSGFKRLSRAKSHVIPRLGLPSSCSAETTRQGCYPCLTVPRLRNEAMSTLAARARTRKGRDSMLRAVHSYQTGPSFSVVDGS